MTEEDQSLRASVNIAPIIATPTVAMTTMNVLNFEFISWRKARIGHRCPAQGLDLRVRP